MAACGTDLGVTCHRQDAPAATLHLPTPPFSTEALLTSLVVSLWLGRWKTSRSGTRISYCDGKPLLTPEDVLTLLHYSPMAPALQLCQVCRHSQSIKATGLCVHLHMDVSPIPPGSFRRSFNPHDQGTSSLRRHLPPHYPSLGARQCVVMLMAPYNRKHTRPFPERARAAKGLPQ